MHVEQPEFLFKFPILFFLHFLSDYEKDKRNVRGQSNLYVDQGGTSQLLTLLCLNPTTNVPIPWPAFQKYSGKNPFGII